MVFGRDEERANIGAAPVETAEGFIEQRLVVVVELNLDSAGRTTDAESDDGSVSRRLTSSAPGAFVFNL